MKKNILFLLFCSLFTHLLFAQNDQIVQDAEDPEAEFNVAINPIDSNNIIIATVPFPMSAPIL